MSLQNLYQLVSIEYCAHSYEHLEKESKLMDDKEPKPDKPAYSPPTHVWYACYGSNLNLDRFSCYIKGGSPEGSSAIFNGSIDTKSCGIDRPFVLKGSKLLFAEVCEAWEGKGVAFLDPSGTHEIKAFNANTIEKEIKNGAVLIRLHLVTFDQFVDVLIQENGNHVKKLEVEEGQDSSAGDEQKGNILSEEQRGKCFNDVCDMLEKHSGAANDTDDSQSSSNGDPSSGGFYRELLHLGEVLGPQWVSNSNIVGTGEINPAENFPVLTFTTNKKIPASDGAAENESDTQGKVLQLNKPGEAYIKVITTGLIDMLPLPSKKIEIVVSQYLNHNGAFEDQSTVSKFVKDIHDEYTTSSKKGVETARTNRVTEEENKIKEKGEEVEEVKHDKHGEYRVIGTGKREGHRGEFILQLPEGCKVSKKGEQVAVTREHEKDKAFTVLARALPDPEYRITLSEHEVAMDQKLRVAIGARKGDWVTVSRKKTVPAKQKWDGFINWSSRALDVLLKSKFVQAINKMFITILDWFALRLERAIGTQSQLMRVHIATIEDMEVNIARIPKSTFDLLGTVPGNIVQIQSTTKRDRVRCAILSDAAIEIRSKQCYSEPIQYSDPFELLSLDRVQGASEKTALAPIFIDYDLRERLEIKPGDAVRVVRDWRSTLYAKVYLFLFPVAFILISAAIKLEIESVFEWQDWFIRIGALICIMAILLAVIIWDIGRNFRKDK